LAQTYEDLSAFTGLRDLLNRTNLCTVSDYPPRECGIATFTRDLIDAIHQFTPFSHPTVIAVNEPGGIHRYDRQRVRFQIYQDVPESYVQAAEWINDHAELDGVSVQHEHGIYGGPGGILLSELICRVKKPIVTTLHTVLKKPSDDEKRAIQEVFKYSDAVVAMVPAARELLRDSYEVDVKKLTIVPHGVPNIRRIPLDEAKEEFGLAGRTVLATFGLISRGKGIEYAIEAVGKLAPKYPDILYLVLGQTHPVVRRHQGEEYRNSLQERVRELGIEKNVVFENRYLSLEEIISYMNATDVFITPYLNPDQIVSGVLSYALGCGKAVVSTSYLYARSVLEGRGVLVDFESGDAIAEGVDRLLSDPAYRSAVEEESFRYGRKTTWHNVAIDYLNLYYQLTGRAKEPAEFEPEAVAVVAESEEL
jgi:glycosyltransferase involved in cell wall biosynthesis